MAIYQTDAVVLGARNWGNADKMMTFFTRERGLVKAAAFGCRRPRSPLAGGMQMFSELELQLSEGKNVDTVRQCTLKRHYKKLSEDLLTMAYGSFVVEFLRLFLPEGQPEAEMYERLLQVFAAFEKRNPRITADAAVYQLLEYTGMQLQFERCVRCGKKIEGDAYFSLAEGGVISTDCLEPGEKDLLFFSSDLRQFILHLRDFDWQSQEKISVRGKLLQQAEALLLNYLQSLTGKTMQSVAFIQQLQA